MNHKLAILSGLLLAMTSCVNDHFDVSTGNDREMLINISGEIKQLATTRANDSGFCNGDVIGVYIVDYNGTIPGKLQNKGNRADNVGYKYDEEAGKWYSAQDIFWRDGHTAVDIYGYYPLGSPSDVNSYSFTVRSDQYRVYDNGSMGGYEASDFLWGKVNDVEPTSKEINLPLEHKMANLRVRLVEGDGFNDGEWQNTTKQVLVINTINDAVIDLTDGTIVPSGSVSSKSITPYSRDNEWRAIVVPQKITTGTALLYITINGIPYKFANNEDISLLSGKMSNFTIKVDKKSISGDYKLTLVSESITPWENDNISHDGAVREYLVIDVTEPGKLEQCLIEAGHTLDKITSLKINGKINNLDFACIYHKLTALTALNLKDVRIVACEDAIIEKDGVRNTISGCADDCIPDGAFYHNGLTDFIIEQQLKYLVLPDILKEIGNHAFTECKKLTGSLIFPEGLEVIGASAFDGISSLKGTLSLPSTLKKLGSRAFYECGFISELKLPDSLEQIGDNAFFMCMGLYGELKLPENLKNLGVSTFFACTNLRGSLEIPRYITEIPQNCFYECGFDGILSLNNNITTIGRGAFYMCRFKGELNLPESLTTIGQEAFSSNQFNGTLKIPASIETIAAEAFYNNMQINAVEIPEGITSIGSSAFKYCSSIEEIVLPSSIEIIKDGAFSSCYGIGSIVCKSQTPPTVFSGAFDGVPKDNFALEVPESALPQYQTATGWSDFKRITAHHELVCRPSVACALSTERRQTLVIDAEGEWELDSKPDWCQLSQSSGNKKTELTLTIKSGVTKGQSREGDVVFRLKGKDYTHKCHVTQYGYQYGEDEYLTLQKATKGNNGGINIVIIGDGYDAKDIAGGSYLADMRQQIEYFFGVEPYTTYRDYFNVYTAFAVSTESGIGTVNTIRYNRFGTTYTTTRLESDYDDIFSYVLKAPTVDQSNIDRTLVIVVPNSTDYSGHTEMWESGAAIAICPKSTESYPYDSRGVVQYQAGGCGFGKLADESIYVNGFPLDLVIQTIKAAKARGWYDNIDITGKMHQVTWSHLIFDPRYSDLVDIYEGGFGYTRGVFRSEPTTCMGNHSPYFSTVSRESIVKRIKLYAGESYSFEDFVANDKRTSGTRSSDISSYASYHKTVIPTQIHKGSPLTSLNKKKNRK